MVNKTSFPESLILASGPKDAEKILLDLLEGSMAAKPEALGPPTRIVVPSRSLRRHLLKALADRFGAVVGFVVQTHRGLALEILERAGMELPAGGARVQDVLARRFAAGEDVLRKDLVGFDDGYAAVAAAVRDLLDANFTPWNLEPTLEGMEASVPGAEGERASAVLRVAAKCHRALETMGLAHRGALQQQAAAALSGRGRAGLLARSVFIYGFAEATGVLSELLKALVCELGAQVVVDHPPDPVRSSQRDGGWSFSERLMDRVAGVGTARAMGEPRAMDAPRDLAAFTAPGPEAEVREVAERVGRLLEEGIVPEKIGVVARHIGPVTAAAIRRHFRRLGIPFSGEGTQISGGAVTRRASALIEIMVSGSEARAESWLGASLKRDPLSAQELDLGLRSLGAARLENVETLDVGHAAGAGGLRLPVVEGLDQRGGSGQKRRRVLGHAVLEEAVSEAGDLVRVLETRPERAPVGAFFDWIRAVVGCLGGVEGGDPDLDRALGGLEDELPGELTVGWAEFEPVLRRALEGLGAVPLGGPGGGVQVLTVMEARARTFDHLFLIGLNRGVFPVQGTDDPVFSTAARRVVSESLPDLPLKGRDRPEERYLFAQLMAAAPSVTLSWQRVDREGKEKNPSVFVERLCLSGDLLKNRREREEKSRPGAVITGAPDVFGPKPNSSARPVLEHAVVCGLYDRGPAFSAAITRLSGEASTHLRAVLNELSPEHLKKDLGPFLGVAGVRPPASVWVSVLDALVRCPWKTFLERELGLEAPPEAAFSEEGLAGPLVGSIVHEVLERVAVAQGVIANAPLDEVRNRPPVRVAWPGSVAIEALTAEVARDRSVDQGIPALAPALARLAVGFLQRARELAWKDDGALVVGVETLGRAVFLWQSPESEDDLEFPVQFRADRVDVGEEGDALVLLDYKTGEPARVDPGLALSRGRLLQGAAYQRGGGEGAVGRYIVLKDPEKMIKKPVIDVDAKLSDGAVGPLRAVVGSWSRGIFFPRVCAPNGSAEGTSCEWCRLKSACHRGDSGVAQRLKEAFDSMDEGDPRRMLWELPGLKAEGGRTR